ncbi:MAG: hypothetical protein IT347_11620 [Candidatus Eisenbacteria bacterium]|nr:hypothetical protein [Candidatus Eisenbacteria bacterium]
MKAQPPPPRNGDPAEAREGVAYAELLKMAHEEGLKSIATELLLQPSEDNGRQCIVKATVETERGRYEGLGDADPGNVEDFLVPHLIRVAETRAKARALRDAVNVGVISLEELDGVRLDRGSNPGPGASPPRPPRHTRTAPPAARPRSSAPARPASAGNGDERMSEAQRRYLFRILAGQGYQREAAEERLRELFEVDALTGITKVAATQMIDRLLNPVPARAGGGNGADARPQR